MITLVFFLSIYYYYINYHECANEIDNDPLGNINKSKYINKILFSF